jgi:hypothetical protein
MVPYRICSGSSDAHLPPTRCPAFPRQNTLIPSSPSRIKTKMRRVTILWTRGFIPFSNRLDFGSIKHPFPFHGDVSVSQDLFDGVSDAGLLVSDLLAAPFQGVVVQPIECKFSWYHDEFSVLSFDFVDRSIKPHLIPTGHGESGTTGTAAEA